MTGALTVIHQLIFEICSNSKMQTPFAAAVFLASCTPAVEVNDDFSLLNLPPHDSTSHDVAHFFGNTYSNRYGSTHDDDNMLDHSHSDHYSDHHYGYHSSSSSHDYYSIDDYHEYHYDAKEIAEKEAYIYSILPLTITEQPKHHGYDDGYNLDYDDYN